MVRCNKGLFFLLENIQALDPSFISHISKQNKLKSLKVAKSKGGEGVCDSLCDVVCEVCVMVCMMA